ncbi:transposase, partial [Streptomyces sp. NPDC002596]
MFDCVVFVPAAFTSGAPGCDCLAHRFGNAADHPDRARCYDSDMSDAEWAVVRPLLPVPAWMEGCGGRPEGVVTLSRVLALGGTSGRAGVGSGSALRPWRAG